MALIDCGQSYTITSDNFSIPNSPASFDIIQIATAATVAVFLSRAFLFANAVTAAIQRVTALRRTSASTGGSAITPNPESGGSSAASCTVLLLPVTTTGTAGAQLDNQQWNEFAPYQFDLTPRGILIPAASWYSLFLPANPAAAFNASITLEIVEIK
jgi:hypothetical protein